MNAAKLYKKETLLKLEINELSFLILAKEQLDSGRRWLSFPELQQSLGWSRSLVSYYFKKLKTAGKIKVDKSGVTLVFDLAESEQ